MKVIMENRASPMYAATSFAGGTTVAEQNQLQQTEPSSIPDLLEVDISKISSAVLARLIEEVREEKSSTPHAYDRVHNRHNRGR